MTGAVRLVVVPGLGADETLLEPQRRAFPDLVVLPWLAPEASESLVAYAGRMAALVPAGEPVLLAGISFGGMLAYEMAHHVRPRALLLIATCTRPDAIPWYNRALAGLVPALPQSALRPPRAVWPLVAWGFGAGRGPGRAVVDHCVETAAPSFVCWGLGAIMRWRPSPPPDVRIVHVHGESDRFIPARNVAATHIVAGAGHLLNVTHAPALNEHIARLLGAPLP